MNTGGKILCVISCGSRKIWDDSSGRDAGPTLARNVYTGNFARLNQKYAERFYPESWCILSARYGFLMPDDVVSENYNVRITDPEAISIENLQEQAQRLGLDRFDRVVVVAGRDYVTAVRRALPKIRVDAPLAGAGGIGGMMKRVRMALERGEPLEAWN
ncbi:MAG TPA: hypothetical protein PLK04_11890 [Bacillota bacterium]|nr:hypothetical protein [Bacillota bacterium]